MKNRLRDKIDNGEPALGAWLRFRTRTAPS